MYFVLARLFDMFAGPGNVALVALAVGGILLWTRAHRTGRGIISVVVLLAVLVAVFPVGTFFLVPLEDRFPEIAPPAKVDGIVVLGGEVDQVISAARHHPTLKDSADRMTTFVALARRYPHAKLVFTGGSAILGRPDLTEAPVARAFFAEQGLDTNRILFENRSRNTYENALYTRALVHPKPGETWLLITSANHMPRAYGCFLRVGWKMVAYPVDYLTTGRYDFSPGFSLVGGLRRLDVAFHEWVGLVMYRILGYTDALFPGPSAAEGEAH